jgi:hypothetical protein
MAHHSPQAEGVKTRGKVSSRWTEQVYEQTLLPQMNWGFPGRYDMWTFRDMINPSLLTLCSNPSLCIFCIRLKHIP